MNEEEKERLREERLKKQRDIEEKKRMERRGKIETRTRKNKKV